MHELSLANALIQTAAAELKKLPETRILSITVEIGGLSGVSADALSFCLPIVSKGTPAEGCRVVFEEVMGLADCNSCGTRYEMEEFYALCPSCGGADRKILQGKEFRLKNMEVV